MLGIFMVQHVPQTAVDCLAARFAAVKVPGFGQIGSGLHRDGIHVLD